MPRIVVSLVYNLLLPLVLLVGLPAFVVKGIRRGGLARNFKQRLGFYPAELSANTSGQRPLWIHAVSVGEVFLALKIVEAIRARSPERRIVLSTTTTTGYAVAVEKSDKSFTVIHNPVDLPWIAAKAIRHIDPAALLLIEAEVWPNLLASAKGRNVPVFLLNARLSPRSASRYARFRAWTAPIFSQLDGITVPFAADLEKWTRAGVDRAKLHLLGSVKFDNAVDTAMTEKVEDLGAWLGDTGCPDDARILLGASTHDVEEVMLAETFRMLAKQFPDLRLVIVPRHAERGAGIAKELQNRGFVPVLRVGSGPNPVESTTQPGSVRVWIANTTGELRAWFERAEVVVVGKSFGVAQGGQNPVEPVLTGRPTIVGPNMQNFPEVVADLVSAEGILQLAKESELPEAILDLLEDPEAARAMALRGASAMERHRGAAKRTAEFVLARLEEA